MFYPFCIEYKTEEAGYVFYMKIGLRRNKYLLCKKIAVDDDEQEYCLKPVKFYVTDDITISEIVRWFFYEMPYRTAIRAMRKIMDDMQERQEFERERRKRKKGERI